MGKYWFGIIKLILGVTFICSSLYLYKQYKYRSYIEAIWETIFNKDHHEGLFCLHPINMTEMIARLLAPISFHPFWIFYVVDIYMYFTKTYYDGYGVPLF